MKISKLFHWLYALIMFLPVFFWIPTAFYYGFNEHSTAQDKIVETPIYYETNEVESLDDIVFGNIYRFSFTDTSELNDFEFSYSEYYGIDIVVEDVVSTSTITNNIWATSGTWLRIIDVDSQPNTKKCSLAILDVVITDLIRDNNLLSYLSECPLQYVKEYQDITYTQSITDSMNNSWQHVWSLPMFSWTHDTFFSAPFNYIAGLFGIQSGNTLSYCLSYWFSISIIWLVFDLMLYVPLLVHRWLDKAGIQ